VGDVEINRETLGELLQKFSSEEEFTAYFYYQAWDAATRDFHEKLPTLKDVDLYLMSGEGNLPKRVAIIRQTGMVKKSTMIVITSALSAKIRYAP
jgi:hypothetical protein